MLNGSGTHKINAREAGWKEAALASVLSLDRVKEGVVAEKIFLVAYATKRAVSYT